MAWLVRQAQPSDFPEVHDVVASAFGREAEAQLVERLHASDVWLPGLALVARPSATPRGRLVGFAAFTRITVGERPALALAPLGEGSSISPGFKHHQDPDWMPSPDACEKALDPVVVPFPLALEVGQLHLALRDVLEE
jgi:hypothetical protein